jgi:hypothetical protein
MWRRTNFIKTKSIFHSKVHTERIKRQNKGNERQMSYTHANSNAEALSLSCESVVKVPN